LPDAYADTPKLMESALDFLELVGGDSAAREPVLQRVRQQAEQLGDKAAARQSLELAIEYYGIAGADAKSERLRAQRQALAQQQMQPAIEAMQRDAAAIQARFADPQQVAEMKRQALEAQRALQADAQKRAGTTRKNTDARQSTDAMAAELGM
jgi:hypothetical protein